jgi:hypothetical protein
MNAQNALEAMWNQIHTASTFSFALEYYGTALGYFVLMIDNVYDTQTAPYSYWEFFYNGQPSSVGIDGVTLNDGDQVVFTYETQSAGGAVSTWKHAKAARKR